MSIFSNTNDPAATGDAPLPAGQQRRAEQAHLNPNDPATQAEAGTPQYGDFGKPENAAASTGSDSGSAGAGSKNDGSNDNPDEFSEFRDPKNAATEDYGTDSGDPNPEHQRGHVNQNKDPEAVRNVQGADADVQRGGWAQDDARYAGGHQKASWEENNDDEHSND